PRPRCSPPTSSTRWSASSPRPCHRPPPASCATRSRSAPDGGATMLKVEAGPLAQRRLADGMDDRPYERFTVVPLSPTIGAEIGGVDLGRPVDDALFAELHRALLEWKVVFFRDQWITSEQHRDFARLWGEL